MNEKMYLRELGKRQLEIGNLPVMQEREILWRKHNKVEGVRPLIVVEMLTFEDELLPPLQCESEAGRRMEKEMLRHIVNHEQIGDDKVAPKDFTVPIEIDIKLFGLEQKRKYATDEGGRQIGYQDEHFIKNLEQDLPKLAHSQLIVNREQTNEYAEFAADVLGDLMPIVQRNKSLEWFFTPSQRIIELMGMEALMFAMFDDPELVKSLYEFVCEDMLLILREQERLELLTANNGNVYAGAGSYGFADELVPEKPIKSTMLWGNLNSQETVGVSEEMYRELVFPVYKRLAKEFGLVYYGCCEPVHTIWESCVKQLHNLRKVSVSPWCDEESIGEMLGGGKVIYSRKPSPSLFGTGKEFDEYAYREHIGKTISAAKNCELEIILRDIYILSGNTQKPRRAVEIIRGLL